MNYFIKPSSLVTFFIILFEFNCFSTSINDRYELYQRPDILELSGSDRELSGQTKETVIGMLYSVALLFEAYDKDTYFYFLARDAEYFYDIAKLVARDDKKLLSRINLINVSTSLSTDNMLKDYLSQNKISMTEIDKGKKFLFVDTGYMGSVPSLIKSLFPQRVQNRLMVFLLESNNKLYNSIETFLNFSDVSYLENFVHITKRGEVYVDNGSGEISSLSEIANRGQKDETVKLMKGIKGFVYSNEGLQIYKDAVSLIKKIIKKGRDFKPSNEIEISLNNDVENIFNSSSPKTLEINLLSNDFQGKDWRWLNLNFEKVFSTVDKKEIVKFLSQTLSFRHDFNVDALEGFLLKLVRNFRYKDFDLLEAVTTAYLPYIIERKNFDINKAIILKAIQIESEETLEKIIWAISNYSPSKLLKYENILIDLVDNLKNYDEPYILFKIISINILTKKNILLMPNLFKSILSIIENNAYNSNRQLVVDTWSEYRYLKGFTLNEIKEWSNDSENFNRKCKNRFSNL